MQKTSKARTLLPLQWPSAPRDRPTRCCRSPAGFLTLSSSFHASLKGQKLVLPYLPPREAAVTIRVNGQTSWSTPKDAYPEGLGDPWKTGGAGTGKAALPMPTSCGHQGQASDKMPENGWFSFHPQSPQRLASPV